MNLSSYTKSGAKSTSVVKLDKAIFDQTPENHQLIKDVYVAYLANGRSAIAKTKTRGLVRGGGKKPWRQKGTGRARVGSSRSPIWRSGGIIFGPTGLENHSLKVSKNAKKVALKQVLSLTHGEKRLVILDDLVLGGKSSDLVSLLKKLNLSGKILIVVDEMKELNVRSSANVENVTLVSFNYLNIFDCLNSDYIVITKPALTSIEKWLGEEK
jgi:large subunit ribosomal protein L4